MKNKDLVVKTFLSFNKYKKDYYITILTLNKITSTVAKTLGPKGQIISINTQQTYEPKLTKDGITVARNINFQGPEKQISQLVQQALEFVDDIAGDSTTTTSVYINELYKLIQRQLDSGRDYKIVIQELKQALKTYEDQLYKLRKMPSIKQLELVAQTSANDKHLGKLIADAVQISPMIQISQDKAQIIQEDQIEVLSGLHLDTQLIHPYFANQNYFTDPVVLISEQPITQNQQIQDVLQQVNQSKRPLIIFAPDISGQALQTLLLNHTARTITVAPLRTPGYGNQRLINTMDLKIILNGKPVPNQQQMWISQDGIKSAQFNNKEINIHTKESNDKTYKNEINQIIKQLNQQLNDKNLSSYEKENIRNRISKYQQKLVKISLSGQNTEEKKDRVVDALNSVRNAMKDGVVCGGGINQCIVGKKLQESKNQSERLIGEVLLNFVNRMKASGVDVCSLCNKQCKNYDINKASVLDSLTGHIMSMRQALDCVSQILNIGGSIVEQEDKKNELKTSYNDVM